MEGQLTPATGTKTLFEIFIDINFNLILSVPPYTIQNFLSSALANYPAIDEETNEKKEDTINRYAALLKKDQLSESFQFLLKVQFLCFLKTKK
jgi:hypothetical protein